MAQRGRVSAAAAAVVVQGGFGKRVAPPDELTDEEKTIWNEVVASEAKDAFDTAALRGLLKDYCRHRATVESLSREINTFKTEWLRNPEGMRRYKTFLDVRDKECRAAASMLTKLRMTSQARVSPKQAGAAHAKASKTKMPWEYDGEDEN